MFIIIIATLAFILSIANSVLIFRMYLHVDSTITEMAYKIKETIDSLREAIIKENAQLKKEITTLKKRATTLEETTKKIIEELTKHEH